MTLYYVDTSALAKRLRHEAESVALGRFFATGPSVPLVSSELLVTELQRVALRQGPDAPAVAQRLIAQVRLRTLGRSILDAAGALEPIGLRSLDAIHLATALELREDIDAVISYDDRLSAAAAAHGLTVIAPGR